MVKTEFMKLLEELDSINEATDSVEAIIAEIEAGAKALLQSSPLQEATELDLDIDNNDIEASQAELDKDWKKSTPWLERVKTWFAEKVLKYILKNEKVYDALITNQFEGNRVESYLVDITYDLQQIHWEQLEEVAIKKVANTDVDTSNLALKVISKDNWYSQEKFFVKVLELIRSGGAEDIYDAVRKLDLALFDYQLVSKELLESGCELNEAVSDIDFKALTDAETEAERLRVEIRDLEAEYNKKVSSAKGSDEEYEQIKTELSNLQDQLSDLRSTYERREWFQVGADDFDHEDWIDEEAYEKVKDRDLELRSDIKKLEGELQAAEERIKQQFKADADVISSKKDERQKHVNISTEHNDKLKQAAEELKPELQAIADYLNEQEGSEVWKVGKIGPTYNKAEGRIIAFLYTTIKANTEFDLDDYDEETGELSEKVADEAAVSEAEYAGYLPEQVIEALELEQTGDGWFKLPNSEWELSNEKDCYPVETPYFKVVNYSPATYWEPSDWDYEEGGNFVVEVALTVGKKV